MKDISNYEELQVGTKIQAGDVMFEDDKIHEMTPAGKIFGVTCLGCEVSPRATWYRPRKEHIQPQVTNAVRFQDMDPDKLVQLQRGQRIQVGDLFATRPGQYTTINKAGEVHGYPAENLLIGVEDSKWYRYPDGPVMDVLHDYEDPLQLVRAAADAFKEQLMQPGYTTMGGPLANELTADGLRIINPAGALLLKHGIAMEETGEQDYSKFSHRDHSKIGFLQNVHDGDTIYAEYFVYPEWTEALDKMYEEVEPNLPLENYDYRDWQTFAKGMELWLLLNGYPKDTFDPDEEDPDRWDSIGVNYFTGLLEKDLTYEKQLKPTIPENREEENHTVATYTSG